MKVTYYVASSVDGYIAQSDGGVDFLNRYLGGPSDYGYSEFIATVDVTIMGSKTYEFALQHGDWSNPEKPTVVFTQRDLPIPHPSVTLTKDSAPDVVARLRDQGHQRAWLMGGGGLASHFLQHGLIDDLMLALTPDVLGTGLPLFGSTQDPLPPHTVELVQSHPHDNGLIQLHYNLRKP